jgi:hypothetical protein
MDTAPDPDLTDLISGVTVHRPGGGPFNMFPPDPDFAIVVADRRRRWGRVLAGIAAAEPRIVTVRLPSPYVRDEPVAQADRERFEQHTYKSLIMTASKNQMSVLAMGPLRVVEDKTLGWVALVWEREALAVPIVTDGWTQETGASDDSH